jgi:uncharacterized membrane protein YqgA involved in biofilm formation
MTGTLINVVTILVGGALGLLLGNRLPERLKNTVMAGLGLFTLGYGVVMFTNSHNQLVVLTALLFGIVLGEWWQIEEGLRRVGVWLESVAMRGSAESGDNRFVRGFLTASLVFCVGPMAILGSIEDGLTGNYKTLAVKSVLDGFGALAFASTLGVGVLFSALMILLYQGGLTLLAAQAQAGLTPAMMAEMTAAGGIIMLAIAIGSLLEIRPIRSGNFLPALLLAPLLVLVFQALGIY